MNNCDYYKDLDSRPFTGERKTDFEAKISTKEWLDGFFNNKPNTDQVRNVTRGKIYKIHKVIGCGDVADFVFINDIGEEMELGSFFFEKVKN